MFFNKSKQAPKPRPSFSFPSVDKIGREEICKTNCKEQGSCLICCKGINSVEEKKQKQKQARALGFSYR
jgi:hypothetical protein